MGEGCGGVEYGEWGAKERLRLQVHCTQTKGGPCWLAVSPHFITSSRHTHTHTHTHTHLPRMDHGSTELLVSRWVCQEQCSVTGWLCVSQSDRYLTSNHQHCKSMTTTPYSLSLFLLLSLIPPLCLSFYPSLFHSPLFILSLSSNVYSSFSPSPSFFPYLSLHPPLSQFSSISLPFPSRSLLHLSVSVSPYLSIGIPLSSLFLSICPSVALSLQLPPSTACCQPTRQAQGLHLSTVKLKVTLPQTCGPL